MAGEADLKAQIVIEAQDQASAVIKNLAGGLSQLGGAFSQIAGMAGPVGIAIGFEEIERAWHRDERQIVAGQPAIFLPC